MPTAITGQNAAVVKQTTKIAVTGCPPTHPREAEAGEEESGEEAEKAGVSGDP
jgi:hypothetical protein